MTQSLFCFVKDRQKLRKMQCRFLRHGSAFFDVTGVIGRHFYIAEDN